MAATAQTPVTLCGRLADWVGGSIAVDIPENGCTVADFRRDLAAAFPALAADLACTRVRFCVDERVVTDDATVLPHHDIAIFPPVSGG